MARCSVVGPNTFIKVYGRKTITNLIKLIINLKENGNPKALEYRNSENA